MAFDNSTISQPDAHRYGVAKHAPIGNHGQSGRVEIQLSLSAADVGTLDKKFTIFEFAKSGIVRNFALTASDMDTNGAPALVLELGDGTTDALYMTTTAGQSGATELTNAIAAAETGGVVARGDVIKLNIGTAAATGAAGTVTISFDYLDH